MSKLLVVIDLQQGWRHKAATEAAMLKTVELCKQFDGEIIHCCFRNDPKSLFTTQLGWRRFYAASDTDPIPEIAKLELPIYWASTYSRLNHETLPLVEKSEHVYIAGVFTDISVFTTALDIFDHNIPVSVVTDCVASLHGQAAHERALHSLDFAIGPKNLVTASEIV